MDFTWIQSHSRWVLIFRCTEYYTGTKYQYSTQYRKFTVEGNFNNFLDDAKGGVI